MRYLSRLVLLAVMAMAVMAPSSAFAQSETEPLTLAPHDLEVREEATSALCPAVLPENPSSTGEFTTSGGCFIHGGGNAITMSEHLFGIESGHTTCDIEFDLRVASNGTGYMTHQEIAGGGICTRRPCHYPNTPNPSFEPPLTRDGSHNEAKPWRTYAEEDPGPATTETLRFLFCTEPRHTQQLEPSGSRHCNYAVPFTEAQNHRYAFSLASGTGSGGARCELEGTFTVEATQQPNPSGPAPESTRMHIEVNHV